MTPTPSASSQSATPSRRFFLQALLALPFVSYFVPKRPTRVTDTGGDFVEVDGWILKREDLA